MASDDLNAWVALLASEKVEFVIVGGHAVAWHGYPRFTGDVDFVMRSTPVNGRRVARVVERFGFGSLGVTEQARGSRSRTSSTSARFERWSRYSTTPPQQHRPRRQPEPAARLAALGRG
jgi:hypothetical protein